MKIVYLWEKSDISVGAQVQDGAGSAWLLAYEPTVDGQDYMLVSMADGLVILRSMSAESLAKKLSDSGSYRPQFRVKL